MTDKSKIPEGLKPFNFAKYKQDCAESLGLKISPDLIKDSSNPDISFYDFLRKWTSEDDSIPDVVKRVVIRKLNQAEDYSDNWRDPSCYERLPDGRAIYKPKEEL